MIGVKILNILGFNVIRELVVIFNGGLRYYVLFVFDLDFSREEMSKLDEKFKYLVLEDV